MSKILTRLSVHNYRAIGPLPLEIELAPITVLVGENGSGKSCMLEALALTAQSATEDPNRRDLVLEGSRFRVPGDSRSGDAMRGLHHRHNPELPLSVGIWASEGDRGTAGINEGSIGYRWTREGTEFVNFRHELSLGGKTLLKAFREMTRKTENGASTKNHLETRVTGKIDGPGIWVPDRVLAKELSAMVNPAAVGLAPTLERGQVGMIVDQAEEERLLRRIIEELLALLEGVQVLSCLRGPQLMHADPGPQVRHVGSHGENTVRLLASIQARTSGQISLLKNWAKSFGLPDLETGVDGNQLKTVFLDPKTKTPLEIWQAATGSLQGLQMATHLLLSPPRSTLLIEEPEANLHPGFEALLPNLFADTIKQEKQVLVSTHSEVLVAALANAVRKKILRPEQVIIWHLERDEAGVHAKKININEKGYMEEWISSFARVEKELFDDWYKTLPSVGDEDRG